jgi:hypothetical protein
MGPSSSTTTVAVLVHASLDLTLVEAQVCLGDCVSTFFHQMCSSNYDAMLAVGFCPGNSTEPVT